MEVLSRRRSILGGCASRQSRAGAPKADAARGGVRSGARLPAMYAWREAVAIGGLMAYGPDTSALCRRAADYVDRVLQGAKPADLPIEQPVRFDFVVNLKTAQALGLPIPTHVLAQATEVLQ